MRRRGALEIPADPTRDAKLRRFAEHYGVTTANQFVVVVLRLVIRIPHPRYLLRVFGAMEREIDIINAEQRHGK